VPGVVIDKTRIITSTEALNLKEVPKHLIIIGGGVIGMEMGSVYARLGSKVSVVEFTDTICGGFDKSLSKELQKVLTKLGFTFYMQHKVTESTVKGKQVLVKATSLSDNKEIELSGDYVLVSTGRKPYTLNLGLDKAGIVLDDRNRIPVNDRCETLVPGIYAIGDVVRGAMLAHKAEDEGTAVAELIAGQKPHINYNLIPNVVYTWPEVASVGFTEEQLKTENRSYKSGTFPFKASGRARASMDLDGFVKVLSDKITDEVLGVHIIGPRAADMIAEAVVAMEFRASAEDLGRISHAHPTFTESLKEAALGATENRSIHS
jgi:dihydrolipoamide dehydrogenase